MICKECNQEIPDNIKICPHCGYRYSGENKTGQSPPAPEGQPVPDNKTEKEFAQELKSKIRENIYVKKDHNEAMNYIDLYLSMIGIDAEVIDYQQKILSGEDLSPPEKKSEDRAPQSEEPVEKKPDEELFELEVETEIPAGNGSLDEIDQTEPEEKSLDDPSWVPDREEEILELDDDLSPPKESGSEPGTDEQIPDRKSEKMDPPPHEQVLDIDDDDQLLVLGPEQEILEVEENTIEPQPTGFDVPFSENNKNEMGEFEIEIGEENNKAIKDVLQTNMTVQDLEFNNPPEPDQKENEETGFDTQPQMPAFPVSPGSKESVETILNDLKEKKKKAFRWLLIGLSVIVFIVLVVVLYVLSARNDKTEHPNNANLTTRDLPEKDTRDTPTLPPQEKKFLEHLGRAREHLGNGDLDGAEISLNLARAIKTTEELTDLETSILQKRNEQKIIQDIDTPAIPPSDNGEEIAFRQAVNSTSIALCREFLKKYPSGKNAFEVRKRIRELEQLEIARREEQFAQKLRLHFKKRLRTFFVQITESEINEITGRVGHTGNRIENRLIEGDPVTIDYTFGLMWHHWDKTMNFRKAKWWANRRYAGYVDWRLPTAEEAATLSETIIRGMVPGSGDPYEIWTGDTNSLDSLQTWGFSPLRREFVAIPEDQYKHLWSVRVMNKK